MTDPTPPPSPNPPEGAAAAPAAAPADAAAEPADAGGDGKNNDVIGIMAAHSSWVVPQWIKAIAFVISVVAIGGLAWAQVDKRATFMTLLVDSTAEPEEWGNRVAPNFNLPKGPAPDGGAAEMIDLSTLKGSWVLVNFWATWCPPCRDEMPSLEMLTRRMARDHGQNIKMVTVTVDEDWNEVNRFFGATLPTFMVLWDRDKKIASSYGSSRFPETYLINPDGRVAAKFTGPRDWYNQGMVQYFDEVVRGKRKPVS
jgi:thiol-disulfide isomerase/thioredoxin